MVKKSLVFISGVILLGLSFWAGMHTKSYLAPTTEDADNKPLYWVAPMDPNYRRDFPGKSPMGMDLIPVYAEPAVAGAVTISSTVSHNLGIKLSAAQKRALPSFIHTFGQVQFNENQISHFHTRVEGWIESLAVHAVGDPVIKGQKLFSLYSPELVNAQEEYLLALQSPNAEKRGLILGTERKLLALGISQQQIDALKESRQIVERLPFYARDSGYVMELNIREGMFITPNTTTVSISGLNQVWIIAEIFERQASEVAVGQKATVTLEKQRDQIWHGNIDYIYPELDTQNRTLKVRIALENRDNLLKPNMLVQVHIETERQTDVIAIPAQAVIYQDDMTRVVKQIAENQYQSQLVTVGKSSEGWIEIISGLQESDLIVSSAQFLIDSESNISAELNRLDSPALNDHQNHIH